MAQQEAAQAQGPTPAHTARLERNRWLPHSRTATVRQAEPVTAQAAARCHALCGLEGLCTGLLIGVQLTRKRILRSALAWASPCAAAHTRCRASVLLQAGGTTPVACKSSLGTRSTSGLAFPRPHSYFPGGCEGQRTKPGPLHSPSPPCGPLAQSIVSTWTTPPLSAGLHPHAPLSLICCVWWLTPAPAHSQCSVPGGAARAAAPYAAAASTCRPVQPPARSRTSLATTQRKWGGKPLAGSRLGLRTCIRLAQPRQRPCEGGPWPVAKFMASLLDGAFKTTPVTLMRCPARRVGRPSSAREAHLVLRQRVSSGRRALHATRICTGRWSWASGAAQAYV